MSDKPWKRLWKADQWARSMMQDRGMDPDYTQVRIDLIRGFEKFNTRPHHNYETWGNGYTVTVFRRGEEFVKVSAEDLDDALQLARKKVEEAGGFLGPLER